VPSTGRFADAVTVALEHPVHRVEQAFALAEASVSCSVWMYVIIRW
jgi:hypothetical protein